MTRIDDLKETLKVYDKQDNYGEFNYFKKERKLIEEELEVLEDELQSDEIEKNLLELKKDRDKTIFFNILTVLIVLGVFGLVLYFSIIFLKQLLFVLVPLMIIIIIYLSVKDVEGGKTK